VSGWGPHSCGTGHGHHEPAPSLELTGCGVGEAHDGAASGGMLIGADGAAAP